jgi:hypothetical protein
MSCQCDQKWEAMMRSTFMVMLFAAGAGIAGVGGVSAAPVVNGAVIGHVIEASQLVQQVQFHSREESRERERRREEGREREHRREESREREHRREESRERERRR